MRKPAFQKYWKLEIDFKDVYKLACLVQDGSCEEIWGKFLSKLPVILENLNLDALELYENDQLQITLKKFIWPIPDFMPSPFIGLAMNCFY